MLDGEQCGVFQKLLDLPQETGASGAIDDPVIAGERHLHEAGCFDLPVPDDVSS